MRSLVFIHTVDLGTLGSCSFTTQQNLPKATKRLRTPKNPFKPLQVPNHFKKIQTSNSFKLLSIAPSNPKLLQTQNPFKPKPNPLQTPNRFKPSNPKKQTPSNPKPLQTPNPFKHQTPSNPNPTPFKPLTVSNPQTSNPPEPTKSIDVYFEQSLCQEHQKDFFLSVETLEEIKYFTEFYFLSSDSKFENWNCLLCPYLAENQKQRHIITLIMRVFGFTHLWMWNIKFCGAVAIAIPF